MTLGFLIFGGVAGAMVALAALLTLGLGPVVALFVFWIGGLAATLALAIDFARNTTVDAINEETQPGPKSNDGA